jgi:hypothetical protein
MNRCRSAPLELATSAVRGLSALLCATGLLCASPHLALADDVGSGLSAGGLTPPSAVPADPNSAPSTQPEAVLDRADKEDSGRGLEFIWLNAELGAEYLGLHTFKAKELVDSQIIRSKQGGALYGAGLGVRLLVFTLGARFRFADFSAWQLWTLNAEAGLRIPLGRLEPYFTVGGGYASLGAFDSSALTLKAAGVSANGFDARAGFGLDVYLTSTLSVGGNLTGEILFLGRAARSNVGETSASPSLDQRAAAAVFAKDGSGIGAGATLSAVLGLHF